MLQERPIANTACFLMYFKSGIRGFEKLCIVFSSYDIASGSDLTPCIKMDRTLL